MTWVLMKCQIGSELFFAWCEASPDHPGFKNIFYTERDGRTPFDPSGGLEPGDLPALQELVAVIPFAPPVITLTEAQLGDTFPDAGGPDRSEPARADGTDPAPVDGLPGVGAPVTPGSWRAGASALEGGEG